MSTEIDQESNESVGDRIRVIRIGLGKSQRDFAKLLNVKQPVVSYVESGARSIPKEMLKTLVNQGFSSKWILTGKNEPKITNNNELKELLDAYDINSKKYNLIIDILQIMEDFDNDQIECVKSFILGMKTQEKLQK